MHQSNSAHDTVQIHRFKQEADLLIYWNAVRSGYCLFCGNWSYTGLYVAIARTALIVETSQSGVAYEASNG